MGNIHSFLVLPSKSRILILNLIILDRVKLHVIRVKLYEITISPFLRENESVSIMWKWLNISRILHTIYSGVIYCFHTLYIGLFSNKYNAHFELMDYDHIRWRRWRRVKFRKRKNMKEIVSFALEKNNVHVAYLRNC